jgi:hypothetical protein
VLALPFFFFFFKDAGRFRKTAGVFQPKTGGECGFPNRYPKEAVVIANTPAGHLKAGGAEKKTSTHLRFIN